MQFLEISWDLGILGFSKILGFFQRFFWIFDEVMPKNITIKADICLFDARACVIASNLYDSG